MAKQVTISESGLRFLAEASTLLSSSLDYATTLGTIAKIIVPFLADWCSIDLLGENGQLLQMGVSHVDPAKEALIRELRRRFPLAANAPYGYPKVIRTGERTVLPTVSPDDLEAIARSPEHLALIKQLGFTSHLCVPLVVRGHTLGAITLNMGESERRYSTAEIILAEDLGRRAALAVEHAQLYRAEQRARLDAERAARRTAELQEITAAFAEAVTPEQVAEIAVKKGIATMGAVAGGIAILDRNRTELQMLRTVGYPQQVAEQYNKFPIDASYPLADAVRTGGPVWLESPEQRAAEYPHIAAAHDDLGNGAWAAIPLILEGRTIGAMGLTFREAQTFSREDRQIMLAIVRQCTQALERARLFEAERAARAQAEAAREREAFLGEASSVLMSTLDDETILKNVARFVVPRLADWCAVHLLEQDGTIRRLTVAHIDPKREELVRARAPRYNLDSNTQYIVPQVLRTGKSDLQTEVPAWLLEVAARDPEHYHTLRTLGVKSYMCVPLATRGRTLGTLTFVCAESARRYNRDDLVLAEELARRTALAVDNARLYRESQSAVRARDQLLSIASHEVKTPLTVIQGYTQLIQRVVDRQKAAALDSTGETAQTVEFNLTRLQRSLNAIAHATTRLTALVNDLLDVSRIENRALNVSPQRMDLRELVTLAVETVRMQQHYGNYPRGVELKINMSPTAVWGMWDRNRLEQVLVNLIDNAVKYSPPHGWVEIQLTVENEPGRMPRVHLHVRDEGIGIPPSEQDKIFRPFMRATNATNRNFPGLGLGLAISREIIERHGGRIWVESAGTDQGSTFHVVLPILTEELEAVS